MHKAVNLYLQEGISVCEYKKRNLLLPFCETNGIILKSEMVGRGKYETVFIGRKNKFGKAT